jgi:hypothetical protein
VFSGVLQEHLEFFGRLKGIPEGQLEDAVALAIQDVQLDMETNKQSRDLSGGQVSPPFAPSLLLLLASSTLGLIAYCCAETPPVARHRFDRRHQSRLP